MNGMRIMKPGKKTVETLARGPETRRRGPAGEAADRQPMAHPGELSSMMVLAAVAVWGNRAPRVCDCEQQICACD